MDNVLKINRKCSVSNHTVLTNLMYHKMVEAGRYQDIPLLTAGSTTTGFSGPRPRDGDPTAFLGVLFQRSTTCTVKMFALTRTKF